jgi:exportin-2 (importin alpha re-exporter)
LEVRPDLSAPYVSIFPAILSPAIWSNQGNVPAVTRLLQAYLHKPSAFPQLLQGNTRLNGIAGVIQNLLRLKSTESFGVDVLTSLVCGTVPLDQLQPLLGPLFNQVFFPRLQPHMKPTPRLFRATTVFFLSFTAVRGFDVVKSVLDSVQPGIFSMLLDKIILVHVGLMSDQGGERKLGAIVLTNLLARTPAFLSEPNYVALWPRVLSATVGLLSPRESKSAASIASAVSGEEEAVDDPDDLLAQAEKGFSTAYARLVFAGSPERDFSPALPAGVSSAKDHFVSSLNQLCAQYPGRVPGMVASLSQEEQAKVAKFCSENGVQIK